jgi:hypothetical protein
MSKPVLVFGSARSGTSWLSELMARPRGYRLLFEPEHETHVPQGHLLADIWMTQPGDVDPARRFLRRLLSNRVDNDWIAQCSYRKLKMHLWPFLVRQIVIKFVRCNLGMSILCKEFDVQAVYVRRNPYDTLFSQYRVRFPWLFDLSKFAANDILHMELQNRYGIDIREEAFSDWEKLAVRWSLENIFVEDYFGERLLHGNIRFVEYERLRGDVESCASLFNGLGLKISDNFEKLVVKPSSKTHPKSMIRNPNGFRSSSKPELPADAKRQIDTILQRFGRENLIYE